MVYAHRQCEPNKHAILPSRSDPAAGRLSRAFRLHQSTRLARRQAGVGGPLAVTGHQTSHTIRALVTSVGVPSWRCTTRRRWHPGELALWSLPAAAAGFDDICDHGEAGDGGFSVFSQPTGNSR